MKVMMMINILSFNEYIKENVDDGIILYHATNSTWRIPEINYLGFHAGTLKAAMDRFKSFQMKINPHIIKLKFHLKNPLYIGRDYRFHDNLTKVSTELYKDRIISKDEMNDFIRNYSEDATFKNLRNLLHDKYGYDGIIYRNNIEDRGSESYISFYPEQIEILDYDFNPNIQENIKSSIITLYHGEKGYRGKKFDKFNFNLFPYFYLSPDFDYCFNYAVDRSAIHTFKIDTSDFIDLTSLHKKRTIKEFLKEFLKITGVNFPSELLKNSTATFWEIIRGDRKGYIAKILLSNGIDGFKMIESYNDESDLHIVYVLLNNDSIVEHD
jgi:hypothetical protein